MRSVLVEVDGKIFENIVASRTRVTVDKILFNSRIESDSKVEVRTGYREQCEVEGTRCTTQDEELWCVVGWVDINAMMSASTANRPH